MRFIGKARQGTAPAPARAAAALAASALAASALAASALAAGCASGAPASGLASAHPAAATWSLGAGTDSTVPPVFAASLEAAGGSRPGDRLALLSSRTGHLLRWLTPQPDRATDEVLSVRDGWVYFARYPIDLQSPSGSPGPAIWRVRVTGGLAQLVQAGASDYAVSPDGRAVAYVTGADHGNAVEVVARNLATGKRNTIIVAIRPDLGANNWPPEVMGLTWAGDDVHLAVQVEPTAAISSVLVFDAFTAATIGGGRTAPCAAAGDNQCQASSPAYLTSGALTYVIQRLSRSGAASASLVAWQASRRTTLLSFPAGTQTQFYDMTAQSQAIWITGPARPKGPWAIWRWSGGTPVKVITFPPRGASPYYGIGAIAW